MVWEKAFDKINQDKLLQILRRLKTPPKMLRIVTAMYNDPKFRITHDGSYSAYRVQNAGIRQGCPLSPYLFSMLMSGMFFDIKQQLNTPKQIEPIKGIRFAEILYADDTLLFGTHTQSINKLLHTIQRESTYYNMKLNMDKCVNLTLNQNQSSIKYVDGTTVPRKAEATYLGTILSEKVDNHREINNRIAAAMRVCHKLKLFWNKANTTVRWKVRVFDAILKSRILYGLECIQLTSQDISKLNAFQMKGLRRILKIPPTFVDRTATNQHVLDVLQTTHNIHIELFSHTWKNRKLKLLGHILRSNPQDPMRQVLFEPHTFVPRIEYRRPGKPRLSWLQETFKEAFGLLGRVEPFNVENLEHVRFIVHHAHARHGIFGT